ncbi:hypothetical protein HAX54_048623, partial [Datura stramonium]|nr:hypothetical protein [Datura stramonium]
ICPDPSAGRCKYGEFSNGRLFFFHWWLPEIMALVRCCGWCRRLPEIMEVWCYPARGSGVRLGRKGEEFIRPTVTGFSGENGEGKVVVSAGCSSGEGKKEVVGGME